MNDIHIEEFYHDIGLILSKLYSVFPRKSNLYVADICGEDHMDEFGLHSDRFLSAFSAMIWLKEQGYIRFDAVVKQESIDQAVLSEKSFLVLSTQASIDAKDLIPEDIGTLPPYIAQKSISNIAVLQKALKSRSAITINQIVFHILEQSKQFA